MRREHDMPPFSVDQRQTAQERTVAVFMAESAAVFTGEAAFYHFLVAADTTVIKLTGLGVEIREGRVRNLFGPWMCPCLMAEIHWICNKMVMVAWNHRRKECMSDENPFYKTCQNLFLTVRIADQPCSGAHPEESTIHHPFVDDKIWIRIAVSIRKHSCDDALLQCIQMDRGILVEARWQFMLF